MQKASLESESGWIRPTGEFTVQQKFAYVFWESIYPFFLKRTVITTRKTPIKLKVKTTRRYNTVLEITFTSQMFRFACCEDDNLTKLAVLRDLVDFRIEAASAKYGGATVLYALDELVSGPSTTNQLATVRRKGEEAQILHPDDFELSTNSQGLLARKRSKPPSITSLRVTIQRALDIGAKVEPTFVYKGDSVSLDAQANKVSRTVLKLHVNKLSLDQANLVTLEGECRSEVDYGVAFKSWRLLPTHSMELNPEGCQDLGMRGILNALFLSLAEAQPFGRVTIAENVAWTPRAATQSQISVYDSLCEECISLFF